MPNDPNFYELLEVAPDAHVTIDWKTLCDEDRRREYDASLKET